MDRKYQVFISSTYEDLKEQRDAVVKAVLKMGHLPVGMEMFNAADQQQWEIIKRHIDNSDYYVLIVANRYGSIGPAGISYTEQEYEYATEKGVPCLGFLLQKGTAWPDTMMETGPAKKKLDTFKKKVGGRPVNFWDNTDKLALQVYASLSEAITLTARPGWIRATEAASPQVAEELARLSKENKRLQESLIILQKETKFSKIEHALMINNYTITVGEKLVQLSLKDVFQSVCVTQNNPRSQNIYHNATGGATSDPGVYQVKKAIHELLLLGLVENQDTVTGYDLWVLTSKGAELYTETRYGLARHNSAEE